MNERGRWEWKWRSIGGVGYFGRKAKDGRR
jgi:hypothetical protein